MGLLLASFEPASFFPGPWDRGWEGSKEERGGCRREARRSDHVSGNGAHAASFQTVTVNLFDLSLLKSLRRLKALYWIVADMWEGWGVAAAGFLCAFLTMMIIKFVSGPPAARLELALFFSTLIMICLWFYSSEWK